MHSKTSAVSLFLNYQTNYLGLSLDFAPLCSAWTCPPDRSHSRWEQPLSTAVPIQVCCGGNTICLLASSSTSAGTEKRGQPLFLHRWETTARPLKCVQLKLCKADLELWSSPAHRATEMEIVWPSTAAASFMKRFPAKWSRGLGEDLPAQHSSNHAACSTCDRDGIWLKIFFIILTVISVA